MSVAEDCATVNRIAGEERKSETHDRRVEGRRYAFVEDVVPVDVFEEGVSLDLFSVFLTCAKSSRRIASEELRSGVKQ